MKRIILAAIFAVVPVTVFAAPVCFPWRDALTIVHQKFGEVPAFIGEALPAGVFTVTVNPDTGSWTLFVQPTPNKMCVVVSGRGWEEAPNSVKNVVRPGA